MNRTLFTILFAVSLLTACGADPETLDTDQTSTGISTMGMDETDSGSETGDGSGTDGEECPVGTEGCPCYEGDQCFDDLTCASNVCVDLGGETDTGGDGDGDGDGDEPNPSLNEPCNPVLAFMGVEPCEWGEVDPIWGNAELSCVKAETSDEFLCVVVTDNQGDGSDIGDSCEGHGQNNGNPLYGCMNSMCIHNTTTPENPALGEWVLPQGFCEDVGPNEYSKCCTLYCETAADCGDNSFRCDPLIGTDFGVCVSATWNG